MKKKKIIVTIIIAVVVIAVVGVVANFLGFNHKHSFGEWETQTPATCESAEVEVRSCKCGEEETREGDPAIGHNFTSISAECLMEKPMDQVTVTASDLRVTGSCENCGEAEITEGIEIEGGKLVLGENTITVKYGELSTTLMIWAEELDIALDGIVSDDTYVSSSKKDDENTQKKEMGTKSDINRLYYKVNIKDILNGDLYAANQENAKVKLILAITEGTVSDETTFTLKAYNPEVVGSDIDFSNLTWNSVDSEKGTYSQLHWKNGTELISTGVGYNVSVEHGYLNIMLAYSQLKDFVDKDGNVILVFGSNEAGLKVASLENKTATNRPMFQVILNDEHFHVFDQEVASGKYLVSAECKKKAQYYKSCVCGAAGTEIFKSSEVTQHSPVSITAEAALVSPLAGMTVKASDLSVTGTCVCGKEISITDGIELENATLAYGENQITVKYGKLTTKVTINVTQKDTFLGGKVIEDTYVSSSSDEDKASDHSQEKEMGTNYTSARTYFRVNVSDVLKNEQFLKNKENARAQFIFAVMDGSVKNDTIFTLKAYNPNAAATNVAFSELTWNSVDKTNGAYSQLHWSNGTEILSDGVGYNVSVSNDGKYIMVTLAYRQIEEFVDSDGNILVAFATNTSGLKIGSMEYKKQTNRPVFRVVYNSEHLHVYDQEVAAEEYLVSANCKEKAKYYMSCVCGEAGTEIFKYGEIIQHSPVSITAKSKLENPIDTMVVKASDLTVTGTCVCGKSIKITDGIELENATLQFGENTIKVKYGNLTTDVTIKVDEFVLNGEIKDDTYVSSNSDDKNKDNSEKKELGINSSAFRTYFRINIKDIIESDIFNANEDDAKVQLILAVTTGSVEENTVYALKAYMPETTGTDVDFSNLTWNNVDKDNGPYSQLHWSNGTKLISDKVGHNVSVDGKYITITLAYRQIADFVGEDGNILFAFGTDTKGLKVGSLENGTKSNRPAFQVILNDEHFCVFDQEVAEEKYLVSSANCKTQAKYSVSCICGEASNDTFKYGELTDHSYGELVAQKDQNCTEDGMKEHYQCSVCEKYFIDVDGEKVETTAEELAIAAAHNMVTRYDETYHWTECDCEGCEEATEPEAHFGGTATETEKAVCEVCGQPYGELGQPEITQVIVSGTIVDDTYIDSGNKEKDYSTSKDMLNVRTKGTNMYRSYFRFDLSKVLQAEGFADNKENATVQFTFAVTEGTIDDATTFSFHAFNVDDNTKNVAFSDINWNSVKEDATYGQLAFSGSNAGKLIDKKTMSESVSHMKMV